MYCLGHFYSKNHRLQTKKYEIAHVVIDIHIPTNFLALALSVFELCWLYRKKKKKKMINKAPYHSPIHL